MPVNIRYRKKPVVVEAIQFTGSMASKVEIESEYERVFNFQDGKLVIPTPEGDLTAEKGDWIVRGTVGEVYPVKPEIFLTIYEPE